MKGCSFLFAYSFQFSGDFFSFDHLFQKAKAYNNVNESSQNSCLEGQKLTPKSTLEAKVIQ